jgi:hypothetical protein
MLARKRKVAHRKPMTLLQSAMGHRRDIAAIALIRKGQAFKSPLQPNKRTSIAVGDCVPCGRSGYALCEIGYSGNAAKPNGKAKAGRQSHRKEEPAYPDRGVCKRRIGSEFIDKLSNLRSKQGPFALLSGGRKALSVAQDSTKFIGD